MRTLDAWMQIGDDRFDSEDIHRGLRLGHQDTRLGNGMSFAGDQFHHFRTDA